MTGSAKKTRVEHFIADYEPLDEETEKLIWERVHKAGWGSDDPASLQIAHDTIMEVRMTAYLAQFDRLPDQMAKAMKSSISLIQAHQAREQTDYARKIAHHIANETRDSLATRMQELEALLAKGARARLRLGLLCRTFWILVAVVSIGYGGYVMGRIETSDLASEFAELAKRPDARVWQNLQRLNMDMDLFIAEFCVPGQLKYFHHSDGRAACDVSLFLEETTTPTSVGYLEHAKGFLASTWEKVSYEALAILGILGAAFGYGLAQIKAWVASRGAEVPWNT